jgi:hypothetical protein
MSSRLRLSAVLFAALVASTAQARAECAPGGAYGAAETVRKMYDLAAMGDEDGVKAVLAPDFYAFDNGKRFTGPEIIGFIKAAHAAGKNYLWDVVEPEVHLACDTVWLTYLNRGSISDASGVQEVSWLESAVVVWGEQGWKLRFLHSTRIPAEAR